VTPVAIGLGIENDMGNATYYNSFYWTDVALFIGL
jgi:hypothetical protein